MNALLSSGIASARVVQLQGRRAMQLGHPLAVEELALVIAIARLRATPPTLDHRGSTGRRAARIRSRQSCGDDLDAHVVESGLSGVVRVALVVDVLRNVSREARAQTSAVSACMRRARARLGSGR